MGARRRGTRSLWQKLRRWATGLRWWDRGTTAQARQRRLRRLLMGAKPLPATAAQWREQRQQTLRQAKLMLAGHKPLKAIQLLTRAQLMDPDHAPYQSLLTKAIELREQRRGGKGRSGLMDQAEGPLRQQVLELEAFIASVEELERLVERAGFPPPRTPQAKAKAVPTKVKASTSSSESLRPGI
ncbi:MAG: hypothetical protein VKN13_05345 [Cyanobacteriota bacterium]|nr:hypothetical protein [Cyanobacteriota bacterium]